MSIVFYKTIANIKFKNQCNSNCLRTQNLWNSYIRRIRHIKLNFTFNDVIHMHKLYAIHYAGIIKYLS